MIHAEINNTTTTSSKGLHVSTPHIELYGANFYGNKSRLLEDIAAAIPDEVRTVADLCTGTGIVAYYLKRMGYNIICSDIMRYPYIRCMSVVANNSTVLTEEDISLLTAPNSHREEYARNFYSKSFGYENADFLDNWASNIPALANDTKRMIAAFLPTFVISQKFNFAAVHWSKFGEATGSQNIPTIALSEIIKEFALQGFPRLLCNNEATCTAFRGDAVDVVSQIEADLLYLDTPYACRGGEYEANYSIFDDLIRILLGEGSDIEDPHDSFCELGKYTKFDNRDSALTGFSKVYERSNHIPIIILSYNSTSKVHPEEIIDIAKLNGRSVENKRFQARRPIVRKGDDDMTYEHLLICSMNN